MTPPELWIVAKGAAVAGAGILWALFELWVWLDECDARRLEPQSVCLAEEQVAADEGTWLHPGSFRE